MCAYITYTHKYIYKFHKIWQRDTSENGVCYGQAKGHSLGVKGGSLQWLPFFSTGRAPSLLATGDRLQGLLTHLLASASNMSKPPTTWKSRITNFLASLIN